MKDSLYIQHIAHSGLTPVAVKVRDYDPEIRLPLLDSDDDEVFLDVPEFCEIYQPDELDDDEYNCVLFVEGAWYKGKTIDFDFI